MSAVSGDQKERGFTFDSFTRRPEIEHAGAAVSAGETVSDAEWQGLTLYDAIDRITGSRDVQAASGRGAFKVTEMTVDRPMMLKGMTLGRVTSTASLLLEGCTVDDVETTKDLILIGSRVTKTVKAPFLYILNAVMQSVDNFRALYWAFDKTKPSSRCVLRGHAFSEVVCSSPTLSLVGCSVQGKIRFQRLRDSRLHEEASCSGQLIIKGDTTIQDPASVNGTIQQDVAYPANFEKAEKNPRNDPEDLDLSMAGLERLTHNLKEELVKAATAARGALAAIQQPLGAVKAGEVAAAPPPERREMQESAPKSRRFTCQKVTALGAGILAPVIACGVAAWYSCFPTQDNTGWFSSSRNVNEWCSYLRP